MRSALRAYRVHMEIKRHNGSSDLNSAAMSYSAPVNVELGSKGSIRSAIEPIARWLWLTAGAWVRKP